MDIKKTVYKLLKEDKRYRENDLQLYYKALVLHGMAAIQGDKVILSVESIVKQKIPPFESITRARRILQEEYPELQASKEVQDARKQLQIQARESKGASVVNQTY